MVSLADSVFGRSALALAVAASFLACPADARRGGSFGSRGSHTYFSPRSTRLSPGYVSPVSRTMTARPSQSAPSYGPLNAPYNRPRFGFGGGLLTGLVTGGLIGAMFGHHGWGGGYGYGGGGGMLAMVFQLALLGGVVWLAMRLFRNRQAAPLPQQRMAQPFAYPAEPYAPQPAAYGGQTNTDIPLDDRDQAAFERLLIELQDAFGHEDYARLRAITTPEVMSYLAEELSDNATHGRRNDVTATRLLEAEVSEAWREPDAEYATVAMRYESIDVTRDRASNAILSGDASKPTATTELWTFARAAGSWSEWKVSAIQDG